MFHLNVGVRLRRCGRPGTDSMPTASRPGASSACSMTTHCSKLSTTPQRCVRWAPVLQHVMSQTGESSRNVHGALMAAAVAVCDCKAGNTSHLVARGRRSWCMSFAAAVFRHGHSLAAGAERGAWRLPEWLAGHQQAGGGRPQPRRQTGRPALCRYADAHVFTYFALLTGAFRSVCSLCAFQ